jgi:hypothetical protein
MTLPEADERHDVINKQTACILTSQCVFTRIVCSMEIIMSTILVRVYYYQEYMTGE